jgi:hypothetical protein
MRRRVEQQANITLRGGCRALEIVGTPDGPLVTAVRCETVDGVPENISADIVADASKHGALTLSFLESAARSLPEETTLSDVQNPSLSVLRPRRASGLSADSAAFRAFARIWSHHFGQIVILSH